MYIAFEEDPNKRNRFSVIIFLICIAVLMLMTAITCEGQTACYNKNHVSPTVTRISSCKGINFESNGKDISISIFADSLNEHKLMINLFVFFPEKLINPLLIIDYEDGISQGFDPFYIDDGYAQFLAKEPQFMKLMDKKINLITFINDGIIYSLRENKIDLFYNFMRGL